MAHPFSVGVPKKVLLYVPANSATMLKRDLEAAKIPVMTVKGKLDFHALRTAYINFALEVSPDVKTAQELARHETADMTLNVYGRAKEERCRAVVESVGNLVFSGGGSQGVTNSGHGNYTRITQILFDSSDTKTGTLCNAGGSGKNNLARKRRTKREYNSIYFKLLWIR